jgi:hypothetical protein
MDKKVFICYRREDSAGHAGRLYDYLVNHFGKNRIFMDIVAIKPGVNFTTEIEDNIKKTDVVILVIGNSWLDINKKRLENSSDYVRLEVETALKLGIPVIPVLVQNSMMPGEDDLPKTIKELAKYNAVRLNDDHWVSDINYLTDFLELSFKISGSLVQQTTKRFKKWVVALYIFSSFLAIIYSSALIQNPNYSRDYRTLLETIIGSVTIALVIMSVVLLGFLSRLADENSKYLSYILLGIGCLGIFLVYMKLETWLALSNIILLGLLNFVEYRHR